MIIMWCCMAAILTALSVWLLMLCPYPHVLVAGETAEQSHAGMLWPTLVLRMVEVALRQGVPIPRALMVVGEAMGGVTGRRIAAVGVALNRGIPWHEAWRSVRGDASARGSGNAGSEEAVLPDILADALASAWLHGDAPTIRLQTAIEQLNKNQRAAIEQHAAHLSVTLLLPTGLCFLPAFVLIGVMPTIASFMA